MEYNTVLSTHTEYFIRPLYITIQVLLYKDLFFLLQSHLSLYCRMLDDKWCQHRMLQVQVESRGGVEEGGGERNGGGAWSSLAVTNPLNPPDVYIAFSI